MDLIIDSYETEPVELEDAVIFGQAPAAEEHEADAA